MNRRNTHHKANKRKRSWLGNWRKNFASTILVIACIASLAVAVAPTVTNDAIVSAESAQYEPYNLEEEKEQFNLLTNNMVERDMAGLDMPDISSDTSSNTSPKAPSDASLDVSPNTSINNDTSSINDSNNESKESNSILVEDKVIIQSIGISGEIGEQTLPTKTENQPEPYAIINSNDNTSEQEPAKEQTANGTDTTQEQGKQTESQDPSQPNESEPQKADETEDYYSSNKELDEILYELYVEEGHDPRWDLSASRSGATIWVEQYEPLTDELIIGLGNLIFREVGGYISTQPYKKAMKTYMLAGSTVLHRREVEYGGDQSIYDVVHHSGQYSTSWAFDLKQRVDGSVDEAYVVAEILLRNGPIGPRNLVYESTKSKHTPYWNTGEDVHFRTTFFDTTSKFEDYEEIQVEEQEVQAEVQEGQTETQESQTAEMQEGQTETQESQTAEVQESQTEVQVGQTAEVQEGQTETQESQTEIQE